MPIQGGVRACLLTEAHHGSLGCVQQMWPVARLHSKCNPKVGCDF